MVGTIVSVYEVWEIRDLTGTEICKEFRKRYRNRRLWLLNRHLPLSYERHEIVGLGPWTVFSGGAGAGAQLSASKLG